MEPYNKLNESFELFELLPTKLQFKLLEIYSYSTSYSWNDTIYDSEEEASGAFKVLELLFGDISLYKNIPIFKVGEYVLYTPLNTPAIVKHIYNTLDHQAEIEICNTYQVITVKQSDLEHITKNSPEYNNKIKRELNLLYILNGDEKLWSPLYGDTYINGFNFDNQTLTIYSGKDCFDNHITINANGTLHEDGEIILFPSKDNKDWSSFISNNIARRLLKNQTYYKIGDISLKPIEVIETYSEQNTKDYECGNYFRKESEAESVRYKLIKMLQNRIDN